MQMSQGIGVVLDSFIKEMGYNTIVTTDEGGDIVNVKFETLKKESKKDGKSSKK
jgi:hypothetical protein